MLGPLKRTFALITCAAICGLATQADVALTDLSKLGFAPSGWMGDGQEGSKYVSLNSACRENPRSGPVCQKWTYTPGPAGWAGVAWQYPPGNWGDKPGKNVTREGFSKVTFFARGSKGGEEVEFFTGGNTAPEKPYPASFERLSQTVKLTTDWHEYSFDLTKQDASSVACAFGWSVRAEGQPTTFYLDGVSFVSGKLESPRTESDGELGKLGFIPSGWMGDGQEGAKWVKFVESSTENPHSAPSCQKWVYSSGGPAAWAGVVWQYPAGNWGDKPGRNLADYSRLTFWARADTDDETVEFFVGGNVDSSKVYQSSLPKQSQRMRLTREWQKFSFELRNKDLTAVTCGFGWSSDHSITMYLDDLQFEK